MESSIVSPSAPSSIPDAWPTILSSRDRVVLIPHGHVVRWTGTSMVSDSLQGRWGYQWILSVIEHQHPSLSTWERFLVDWLKDSQQGQSQIDTSQSVDFQKGFLTLQVLDGPRENNCRFGSINRIMSGSVARTNYAGPKWYKKAVILELFWSIEFRRSDSASACPKLNLFLHFRELPFILLSTAICFSHPNFYVLVVILFKWIWKLCMTSRPRGSVRGSLSSRISTSSSAPIPLPPPKPHKNVLRDYTAVQLDYTNAVFGLAQAVADPSDADILIPNEDLYAICPVCTDYIEIAGFGECNHHLCMRCMIRMRALYNDKKCSICKVCLILHQTSDSVDWNGFSYSCFWIQSFTIPRV